MFGAVTQLTIDVTSIFNRQLIRNYTMFKNKLFQTAVVLLGMSVLWSGCAATAPAVKPTAPKRKVILSKGPKKRIAVVDFVNKTAYGRGRLGSAATDILINELVRSQQFIMIERDKLNQIMQEQGLGMSGVVDARTATKAGRVLGLNAIVTGSVSQFGVKTGGMDFGFYKKKQQTVETTVDIRVVDASSGQILLAESGQGLAETATSEVLGMGGRVGYDETLAGKALRSAIVKLINNIIQSMQASEWSGRIAQLESDTVYLNAGRQVGLELNDKLDVFRPGKEIIDPATGLSLGFTQSKIGQVMVTGFFGKNGAIAEIVSGTGYQIKFKINDIVKLTKEE